MLKYADVLKKVAAEGETPEWQAARESLAKLLKPGKGVVQYVSDPNMDPSHVAPYAKDILSWHPDYKHNGQLEMYFNDKGYPLGYNFADEDGIHTDASDAELRKAKIVALIKQQKLK